ncbi:glycosyltransferase family 4 protein [Microbacterium paraoxydans]|uniref:glycosyltransferase family 4 protein n=1 Tax=Microbacterium paraoxydans TaxID=199592 RepID=UPI00352C5110
MSRRRRAVIATRLYTPEVTAASFRMEALAHALAADTDVTVLSTKPPRDTVIADAPGVVVRRAPVLRDRSGAIRGYVPYLSFDVPLFFRLLVRRSDVIVAEAPPTTGFAAAIAAFLTRRPLVYYPGDVWTDAVASMDAPAPVVAVMRFVERFVLRRAARSLAVSAEVADRLAAIGGRPDRVATVGNGIDTAVFRPDVVPHEAEQPYFVYTGTMSEWQQPDVFIRALALLPDEDVELRFFGQGAVEAELKELAARLAPGRVHFGGLVGPATSASWIRGAVGALVSIVPGIGYDFARPTKTYAAAAVGTPVLFTGAETGGEVVRAGGLGEAVAFDPEEVAAAMRRLLSEWASGETERIRADRAAWAADNASLATVGARAAEVVRGARRGSRSDAK